MELSKALLSELINVGNNEPLFPGNTQSKDDVQRLIDLGLVKRHEGNYFLTPKGREEFRLRKIKKYVVAILSFFENDIKQFIIEAENDFDAIKKGMLLFTKEEYRQSEINFQNSDKFPKQLEGEDGYYEYLLNSDMTASVIEIPNN